MGDWSCWFHWLRACSQLLNNGKYVVALDALTYSGRMENLEFLDVQQNFQFVKGSICDDSFCNFWLINSLPPLCSTLLQKLMSTGRLMAPPLFWTPTACGTFTLLSCLLQYWQNLKNIEKQSFRYVQVSTDEVYGSVSDDPATENCPIKTNSPCAASKASGDLFVRSFFMTYGFPAIITRGANTFGHRQFPENSIPALF